MKRSKAFKKTKRKMNKRIRTLNNQLKNDVFGDRFYCRSTMMDIATYFDGSWTLYYDLEFIDRKTGETRKLYLISDWSFIHSWKIFEMMNDLIINSDFWDCYKKQQNQKKTTN